MFSSEAAAELAGPQQTRQVCQNWLTLMVDSEGSWAGSESPRIIAVDEVIYGNTLLGYCYKIEPSGYVVVPTLMDLAPVKASSSNSSFDPEAEGGFSLLVRESLYDRYQRYTNQIGDPAAVKSSAQQALPLAEGNRQAWKNFLVGTDEFVMNLSKLAKDENSTTGPLLTTAWHQGAPYNNFCPMGDDGELCIVGCVATAIAQVMVYHGSPYAGTDRHQYYWYGDGTCGGAARPATLSADFSDNYDFDLMPDNCTVNDPQRLQDAVAELCYEVGVSVEMNFGVCWSGSNTANAQTVLPEYFRYFDIIELADRSDFTPRNWFNLIMADLDRGNPLLYSFALAEGGGHAVVCDGWRIVGGIDQIHLNYGWGGSHTAWYALDDIYASVDPEAEKVVCNIIPGPSEPSAVGGQNLEHQGVFVSSSPNPFNPQTTVKMTLDRAGSVVVSVFDVAGRRVAELHNGLLDKGEYQWVWNGMSNSGVPQSGGVYFCRAEGQGWSASTKLVLVP